MGNINVIVENIDNVDEEETVIIESNPEVIEDAVDVDISLKNKGHLVEQILEQIKEGEKNNQSVEVDWETNGKYFDQQRINIFTYKLFIKGDYKYIIETKKIIE